MRARSEVEAPPFDFLDLYLAQVSMLRLGDVALLTVFNDCGIVGDYLARRLANVTGPLSALQLLEVAADSAACNLHLKTRPVWQSFTNVATRESHIVASRSAPPEFCEPKLSVRGGLMEYLLKHHMPPDMTYAGFEHNSDFWAAMREGKVTFLYDADGKFVTAHIKPNS